MTWSEAIERALYWNRRCGYKAYIIKAHKHPLKGWLYYMVGDPIMRYPR